jgi:hypothetical protein
MCKMYLILTTSYNPVECSNLSIILLPDHYEKHGVKWHARKPLYPSNADIKALRLEPQGYYWEEDRLKEAAYKYAGRGEEGQPGQIGGRWLTYVMKF